jgi:hypothetical protein
MPAAIVADQVQRRAGRPIRLAHGMKDAGQADVVDVVADLMRQRPGLAPAGDAAIDQAGVARGQIVRSQAQPLHDAGPKAFDHRIGRRGQRQHTLAVFWRLQIDGNGRPSAMQHGAADILEHAAAVGAGQAQHLGPQIGQHHAREGHRTQAVEFQNTDAAKGRHGPGLAAVGRGVERLTPRAAGP